MSTVDPQDTFKRQRSISPLEEKRPQTKRARALSLSAVLPARSTYMKRDPNYYLEDGSCIFLVEDTLFNVHRSILSKDNSSFSTMFCLPQGDNEAEGRSDDRPIVLPGDTVSEFRNFLWALYALPHELRIATSPDADLSQLIDIARVSNKYSFKSLEAWALDAINDYVNRKPCPILSGILHAPSPSFTFVPIPSSPTASPVTPNTALLTKLIRLAQMCSHQPLLNTMIDNLRQLMTFSSQYAYLAMTLADELDIRTLRGLAYFEVMHKPVVVKRLDAGAGDPLSISPSSPDTACAALKEGDIDDQGRLIVNRTQRLRLLSGYYRLSRAWEDLRNTPPSFEHSNSCGATWHQHGCGQSWLEFWREKCRTDAVVSLGLADSVGRLRQVQKEFDKWGSAPHMHHDCKTVARKCLQDAIKKIEDHLPDYFSEDGSDET